MDVPKVPPAPAVDQLAAVLDSPEVARLIADLEALRWTGRPGYPVRAMVGMGTRQGDLPAADMESRRPARR